MIKIGIDPSGTGTTAIVVFENNKLIEQFEFINKFWINHANKIIWKINENYKHTWTLVMIENCLPTNVNASKDRDDLLRLLGAVERERYDIINWVSPKYTKSVVKNMENQSKYNENIKIVWNIDENLSYEYKKGWKYNNEKISNHIRDAIIIAHWNKGDK